MNIIGKKFIKIAFIGILASGALLTPIKNSVFAAEPTATQNQQSSSTDASQNSGNDHASHHRSNQ